MGTLSGVFYWRMLSKITGILLENNWYFLKIYLELFYDNKSINSVAEVSMVMALKTMTWNKIKDNNSQLFRLKIIKYAVFYILPLYGTLSV